MKIPLSFCRINGCCYVIVSNSVIGGSFWVDLVWLAALTVRLQVSYCSRMSDYNCTEWLVKNKAANALITFEKIVMVMINSAIFEKQLKALHVVHTFILTWSCLDHDLHLYVMMTYGMRNRRIFIGQAKRCFRDWPFFFYFSGGFISYLFGDYENIDMWRSDYMMNDRDNDNFNYYIAVGARGQY